MVGTILSAAGPDPGPARDPGGRRLAGRCRRRAARRRDRRDLPGGHGDPRPGLLADRGQDRRGPVGAARTRGAAHPGGAVGFAELGRLVPPPVPPVAPQGRDHVGGSPARPVRLRGPADHAPYAASLDRRGDDGGSRRAGRHPWTRGAGRVRTAAAPARSRRRVAIAGEGRRVRRGVMGHRLRQGVDGRGDTGHAVGAPFRIGPVHSRRGPQRALPARRPTARRLAGHARPGGGAGRRRPGRVRAAVAVVAGQPRWVGRLPAAPTRPWSA